MLQSGLKPAKYSACASIHKIFLARDIRHCGNYQLPDPLRPTFSHAQSEAAAVRVLTAQRIYIVSPLMTACTRRVYDMLQGLVQLL